MRNSLNMTALVLVAAALLQKLDTSGGGSTATQEAVQEAVGVACDTVRLLRHAGADPAATMLGFGAPWTSMAAERRQCALPYALILMDSVLELDTWVKTCGAWEVLGCLGPASAQVRGGGAGAWLTLMDKVLELDACVVRPGFVGPGVLLGTWASEDRSRGPES